MKALSNGTTRWMYGTLENFKNMHGTSAMKVMAFVLLSMTIYCIIIMYFQFGFHNYKENLSQQKCLKYLTVNIFSKKKKKQNVVS